jgi:hypothetical protein
MAKQTVITKKRRGPAPTGKGTLVGVRLQPDALAEIDGWIAEQGATLTRPEAVRRLVDAALALSKLGHSADKIPAKTFAPEPDVKSVRAKPKAKR